MTVGVEPDYPFALSLPKTKRRAFFLAEVDRGTMPIERHDLKYSSILRKLLAYQHLWKSKAHQCPFRLAQFPRSHRDHKRRAGRKYAHLHECPFPPKGLAAVSLRRQGQPVCRRYSCR